MFNYNLLYLFPELALKNYEPLKNQYSKNLFHKNLASRASSSFFFFFGNNGGSDINRPWI